MFVRQDAVPRHADRPPRAIACALSTVAMILAPLLASAQPGADPQLSRDLLNAMRRDLGLDARRAAQYVQVERAAIAGFPQARRHLGAAYAGSWIEAAEDGRFRMVIAVNEAAVAREVRRFAAEPRVFERSLLQLQAAKDRLDRTARLRKPLAGVHTWYVDVKTNQVVIETAHAARGAASDFVAASGADPGALRIVELPGAPRTSRIVGGERFWTPYNPCSVGFAVTRGMQIGFATAGHCGPVGAATVDANRIDQGVVAGSIFPGADMGWVQITDRNAWWPTNWVNTYPGYLVVSGAAQAPIGAAVCRSGATTGYRCGQILATNTSVNYQQGLVLGLTRTSACGGGGDSGGAFVTPGGQAQGVTSGGSIGSNGADNCDSATPVTFFQPLQPLLNQYGLTLALQTTQPQPPAAFTVSGRVATAAGLPVAGVSISNGSTAVTTDAQGEYTFSNVVNGPYTLIPRLTGYAFSPAARSIAVDNAHVVGQDFVAAGTVAIQSFTCPIYLNPERTRFYCEVFYTAQSTPTVTWMGGGFGATDYSDSTNAWYYVPECAPGARIRITATVREGAYSEFRSSLFNCGGGAGR